MTSLVPRIIPHFKKPWQLMVSVCVTRMSRVGRPLTQLEQRYALMQQQLEHEASVLNDHEHRKTNLERSIAKLRHDDIETEEEQLHATKELLDDLEEEEEVWRKDFDDLVLASCETEADKTGVVNTMNRRLDDIVHCVIPDTDLLSQCHRLYPYTSIQSGESLRSAGERLLRGHSLHEKVVFFSNAPVGVLRMDYGEEEGRGELFKGAKVFFMRAHVRDNVPCASVAHSETLEWLTLDELAQCTDERYFKKVKPFVR